MNFELKEFNGKAIIFIGRGREGLSFEKFIKSQTSVSSFLFIDQQDDPSYLDSLRNMDFTKTFIVKTAGCPGRLLPAPYTTPTKVFFECIKQLKATVIGITGTKGKTTTTSLLGAMLKTKHKDVRICGNIGIPMLDALNGATQDTLFVVELSSYQLAELEEVPHVAIVTNLYNDHVDYHGTEFEYQEAKRNIMRNMKSDDTLIYNSETEQIQYWLNEGQCKSIAIKPEDQIDMSKSKLIGAHNAKNALMARTAAGLFGVDGVTCQEVIESFEPVPHRLQKVAVKNRITYIDDAIGSNPEATIAGITTVVHELGPIACLMLGGQDRNYEYWPLMQLVSRLGIPYLVLFPDTGKRLKALLPASYKVTLLETDNMEEAVKWAAERCPVDSFCLLSTAAPSYSIWKDFEEKGDLFQKAVNALTEKPPQADETSYA
ncbi:MAG: UDP-N-acetylmuramoyl-L-alanine--D-glutamate ligase [bacterium]